MSKIKKFWLVLIIAIQVLPLISVIFPTKVQAAPSYVYRSTDSDKYVVGPIIPTSSRTVNFRMMSTGRYVSIDIVGGSSCEYTIRTNNGQERDNNAKLKVDSGGACGTVAGKSYNITIATPAGGGGGTPPLSGQWVNHSTITYNGITYRDSKIDDNLEFTAVNPPDCSSGSVINGFRHSGNNTSNAIATVKIKLCNGEVRDIKFTNTGAFSTYFWWQDATTITTTDETGIIFHQFAKDKEFFGDKGRGGSSQTPRECYQSGIDTQVGFTGGNLRQRNINLYEGWPDEISGADLRYTGGCGEADPIAVTIGGVANSQKPAGSWSGNSTTEEDRDTCESAGGPLGWIACPVINLLDGFLNWIDSRVQDLLTIPEATYRDENLYETWSNVRNIAYLILVPIMLVMVLGTALGFEFVSAYTVKKAMPRFFVAILFITLSWEITGFLIQMSNDVGQGVLGLITNPLSTNGGADGITLQDLFKPSAGGAAIQYGGAGGVFLASIVIALNPQALAVVGLFLLSAALTIFIAFLTLLARQLILLALILFLPLAILTWIFPGNDKTWKFAWGTFTKLLIMFPLITGLIGIGRVLASTIGTTDGSNAVEGGILNPILKLTAYILPYLFIPYMFKAAGGILGNIMGVMNDKSRGAFDRLKNARKNKAGKAWEDAKNSNWTRGGKTGAEGNKRGLLNRGLQQAALINKAGLRPRDFKANLRKAVADQNLEKTAKDLQEQQRLKAHEDDVISGAMALTDNDKDAEAHLEKHGGVQFAGDAGRQAREDAMSFIRQTRNQHGMDQAKLIGARRMFGSSTAFERFGDLAELIDKVSGGNQTLQTQLFKEAQQGQNAAGRTDIGGSSYATGLKAIIKMHRGYQMTDDGKEVRDAEGQLVKYTKEDATEEARASTFAGKSADQILASGKDKVGKAAVEYLYGYTDNAGHHHAGAIEKGMADVNNGTNEVVADVIKNVTADDSLNDEAKQEKIKQAKLQESVRLMRWEESFHIAASRSSADHQKSFGNAAGEELNLDMLPPEMIDRFFMEPVEIPVMGVDTSGAPVQTGTRTERRQIENVNHGAAWDKMRNSREWQLFAKEYGAQAAAAGVTGAIASVEPPPPVVPQTGPL